MLGEKKCSYPKRNRAATPSLDPYERMDLALKAIREAAEIMDVR